MSKRRRVASPQVEYTFEDLDDIFDVTREFSEEKLNRMGGLVVQDPADPDGRLRTYNEPSVMPNLPPSRAWMNELGQVRATPKRQISFAMLPRRSRVDVTLNVSKPSSSSSYAIPTSSSMNQQNVSKQTIDLTSSMEQSNTDQSLELETSPIVSSKTSNLGRLGPNLENLNRNELTPLNTYGRSSSTPLNTYGRPSSTPLNTYGRPSSSPRLPSPKLNNESVDSQTTVVFSPYQKLADLPVDEIAKFQYDMERIQEAQGYLSSPIVMRYERVLIDGRYKRYQERQAYLNQSRTPYRAMNARQMAPRPLGSPTLSKPTRVAQPLRMGFVREPVISPDQSLSSSSSTPNRSSISIQSISSSTPNRSSSSTPNRSSLSIQSISSSTPNPSSSSSPSLIDLMSDELQSFSMSPSSNNTPSP